MYKNIEELFSSSPFWKNVYYELYLKIKDNAYNLKLEAIDVFKEVVSQCQKVLKDPHPEDCFKRKYWDGMFYEGSPIIRRYESNLCLSLMYVALSLCQKRNDNNVKGFLYSLKEKMIKVGENCFFPYCDEYVKNYYQNHPNVTQSVTQTIYTPNLNTIQMNIPKNSDVNQALREFITEQIEYAESFPWNENSKAEVIKSMLLIKYNSVPEGVITEEMRKRIMNLGKKEAKMQVETFKAEAFYNIHNNKNVITK